jgi:erythromycin esterase
MKKILKVIAILIITVIILSVIGLNYKTVLASHKIKDVVAAGTTVEEFTIPSDVEIVGVGEATHGNKEFQEIKLEMFKKLVKENGFTAFAIEADYGDCLAANEYIQSGEGDAREIVNNMMFTLYHTEEMADTLEWMRDYNMAVNENQKLRFYGFDMQNPEVTVPYLLDYLKKNNIDVETTELEKLTDYEVVAKGEKVKKELADIRTELNKRSKEYLDYDLESAFHMTTTISQYMDYEKPDQIEMLDYRDKCMAENVTWILDMEKQIGGGKVMLGAHDGHIGKKAQLGYQKTSMGGELKEKYGDKYYSLGTDFFKTTDNISLMLEEGESERQRKDYSLTSADPLAYQAKYFDNKRYCLDFTTLSETEQKSVYDMVHSEVTMGSVGEGFADIYRFMHMAYRIDMVPADLYDGMIFYYKTSPIEPE